MNASRPVSRVLYGHRGCPRRRGSHSSGMPVTGHLGATYPDSSPGNRLILPEDNFTLPLFGLAPDGVYHAGAVADARGGLLPHPFTLTITDKP